MARLHLVLDHSALIPCGDKPDDEKAAIALLGDKLFLIDAVWHVSAGYLKTLRSVLIRDARYCHPLPKFQSALSRTVDGLIGLSRSRHHLCRPFSLSEVDEVRKYLGEVVRLSIHVVASSVLRGFEEDVGRVGVRGEDREVLSLALVAHRDQHGSAYLVTADRVLARAAGLLGLRAVSPNELVRLLGLSG